MEFLGWIDSESRMDGGVEVGQGDGILDRLLRKFVGDAVGSLMVQAPTREQEAEALRMVTTATAAVESCGTPELGAYGHQGLVEQVIFLKVSDKGGQCIVQFLDEEVLIELALVMGVPAGAVEEVEVMGNLDEANTALDQPAGKQTTLTKLSSIGFA